MSTDIHAAMAQFGSLREFEETATVRSTERNCAFVECAPLDLAEGNAFHQAWALEESCEH